MTRSQQIKQASFIPIGGCEDQARSRVLQLFKKDHNINYSKFDNDKIDHINEQYEEDQTRYNYLVNKMFDTALNEHEQIEFNYLCDLLADTTTTHYIVKIIDHSKIVIDILCSILPDQTNNKTRSNKIKQDHRIVDLKRYIMHLLTVFNSYNDKCIKIKLNQAYFVHYVRLKGIFDYMKMIYLYPSRPLPDPFLAIFLNINFFKKS